MNTLEVLWIDSTKDTLTSFFFSTRSGSPASMTQDSSCS